MTNTSSPQIADRRARKNVVVLIAAQAILGAQMPINFVLGGLSGQMLATDKCLATLPISLIVLGSMITAPFLSNFMASHGRRAGFVVGASAGAVGAATCAYGLYIGSFMVFLIGAFITGIYMSANSFYRFAAMDTASDAFKPKAVSYVMAGGLMAAIIGPQLVKFTDGATDIPFMGGYFAAMLLNVFGVLIFLALDIPKPPKAAPGDAPMRSRRELLRSPVILVAIICAMVGYGLMNLVMTSTPLAVVGCGFSTGDAADVVMAHVLAMFVPSFFTGHLIARYGPKMIVSIGLVILCAAALVALSGVTLTNFFVALVLLGIGWNFSFIGGTALLATGHSVQERARAQGMNDFVVFGFVTMASLASGGLMNCSGGDPVQGWSLVNYAVAPPVILAGFALIWLTRMQRKAA